MSADGGGGLAASLLQQRPRETSGAPTANRFVYQRTWALCHLLGLHEAGGEYVLIMEFHDDVLVLNSASNPTTADFFQVKTRADKWRQAALLSIPRAKATTRRKGAAAAAMSARSILAKLLDHAGRFGAHARSLNIVSNARFDLPVADPPACLDREKTCLIELEPAALAAIRARLKEQLALEAEPSLENVFLMSSGISLTEHHTHGAGELAGFLDRRRPGARYAVQPLYRALCDELTRRATQEWQPTTFRDLCTRKGISRQELEAFLLAAENSFDPQEQLAAVKAQLSQEGVPYREILEIERGWRRYEVERMSAVDTSVQSIRANVLTVVEPTMYAPDWTTLHGFVVAARTAFTILFGPLSDAYDTKYLEGAILFELKTVEARQLQTASPKPSVQAP